jgi:quercetin dioxygenase-like cupin family protein
MTATTTVRSLQAHAARLGDGWAGAILGTAGNSALKLFKVSGQGLPPECHADYNEALLMLDGEILFILDGREIRLRAGDLQIIPAGATHAIAAGGSGSFLLVDPG